jgi:hypothetical protein
MTQHLAQGWLQYRHGSHAPTSLSARDRPQSDADVQGFKRDGRPQRGWVSWLGVFRHYRITDRWRSCFERKTTKICMVTTRSFSSQQRFLYVATKFSPHFTSPREWFPLPGLAGNPHDDLRISVVRKCSMTTAQFPRFQFVCQDGLHSFM